MNSRIFRIVFVVAGLGLLYGSVGFFRSGAVIGGAVFAAAGLFFVGTAIFRRR